MIAKKLINPTNLETIRKREPYHFEKASLTNGSELYFQKANVPFVRLGILFKFGSRQDPPGKEGLVHMLEHLLSTKTKEFPSFTAIKEYEEEHGLGINYGEISFDSCRFSGACLKEDFSYLLHLLSQIISFSCWGDKELIKEKQVVVQEFRKKMLPQMRETWTKIGQTIFGDHPLALVDNLGKEETITTLKPGDIRKFANNFLVPKNAAFVLISDFEPDEAKKILEKTFPPRPGFSVAKYRPIVPPVPKGPKSEYSRSALGVKGENQTFMEWGFSFSGKESPWLCHLVFPLLNRELEQELRTKRGWVYGVDYAWRRLADLGAGWFTLYLPPKQEKQTEKIFWKTITKASQNASLFLSLKKRYLKSTLGFDINYSNVLDYALGCLALGEKIDSLEENFRAIASLTFQDFQNFVKKYISPDRTHLTIIRP